MTTETAQVRAGCYCRISSDPKDKRQGVTRQREDTAVMCEVTGWAVADYYVDNDRSASSGKDRPEWNRLLADVKAGKIDAIVVWNQDRGWRMMADLEDLRRFFTSLDRPVPLATTNIGVIDFRNADDVFRVQVSTAMSEMEIAKMRVRQRRAARQRAEQGRPKWRRAFGYLPYTGTKETDSGHREPDPVTAPLVAEAYRAILMGASLSDVYTPWNQAGHYGITGRPWTATTLSLFLRKARNAGLRSHTDTDTGITEIVGPGTWPGLIDEDTWRAAQHVLGSPERKPGPKSVRRHLLTGIVRCGRCAAEGVDARLSGQWVMQPTGGTSGRPKAGEVKEAHPGKLAHKIAYQCKRCHKCGVRAHHLEPRLLELVGRRLAESDAADLLKVQGADPARVEQLRSERATLYAKLDALAVERAEELLTARQVQIASAVVQDKIDALDAEEADAERVRVLDGIPLGTPEAGAAVEKLSPDRFRAVLDLLAVVMVAPKGKSGSTFDANRVTVEWNE